MSTKIKKCFPCYIGRVKSGMIPNFKNEDYLKISCNSRNWDFTQNIRPRNKYMFKVNIETLEKGEKYIQR